jgi:hypothetical protein
MKFYISHRAIGRVYLDGIAQNAHYVCRVIVRVPQQFADGRPV